MLPGADAGEMKVKEDSTAAAAHACLIIPFLGFSAPSGPDQFSERVLISLITDTVSVNDPHQAWSFQGLTVFFFEIFFYSLYCGFRFS